jgi:hypothetical protein
MQTAGSSVCAIVCLGMTKLKTLTSSPKTLTSPYACDPNSGCLRHPIKPPYQPEPTLNPHTYPNPSPQPALTHPKPPNLPPTRSISDISARVWAHCHWAADTGTASHMQAEASVRGEIKIGDTSTQFLETHLTHIDTNSTNPGGFCTSNEKQSPRNQGNRA